LRRLWCAIELFVFVSIHDRMNASKSDCGCLNASMSASMLTHVGPPLEVCILGQTEEQQSSVREGFKTFDAKSCECFKAEDKQWLLGIVEAGSGTMDRFNVQIRSMMERFLHQTV
jgi:hypothetical protein